METGPRFIVPSDGLKKPGIVIYMDYIIDYIPNRRYVLFKCVIVLYAYAQSYRAAMASYEPPRGKTNNVVSDQVRHKLACTATEKS